MSDTCSLFPHLETPGLPTCYALTSMGKKVLSKLMCLTLSPWASISVKYLVYGIQWQHFTCFYCKIISRTANAFFTTQNECFLPMHIRETIPENPTPFERTHSKNSLSLDPFLVPKSVLASLTREVEPVEN